MLSPTFRSPRAIIEAGGVTLPDLCEWHGKNNRDYPLFRFHDGTGLQDVSYGDAIKGIRRAARYVQSFADPTSREPIALLANADSITYTITSLGILRAGHILLAISVRNASAAVVELMKRTDCKHILVSEDDHMQALAGDVTRELPWVRLYPIQSYEDLFLSVALESVDDEDIVPVKYSVDDIGMILHSSGSTSHPKPIYWTHKRMVSRGTTPWYGEVDLTGSTIACHATPMFHALGFGLYTSSVATGIILCVFPPRRPPIRPTPESAFDGARATRADYISTFPPFVEVWARDPQKVLHLAKIKGVWYGGGELKQEVGDVLATQGVSLIISYGCTEVGAIANVMPAKPGVDYAYFTISPWVEATFVDAGDGKYELVVLSPPECPLAVVNTKIGDRDGYATSDLAVPHPSRPGLWKLYGRRDDQIVLLNGEKTNPLPLEGIINEDPHVQDCLIFGNGRIQNGVLVQPKAEYAIDPQDLRLLADFRNKIWVTVQRANEFAPQQSRIFKEMILVTSPLKPFDYNAKGNVRRNPILKRYAQEIDDLYATVAESAHTDHVAPTAWDETTSTTFVRAVIHNVLHKSIPDTADLFRNGCDSLQATWIRNTLLKAIRDHSPTAASRVSMDIVYNFPNIKALSNAVLGAVGDEDGFITTTTTTQDLWDLSAAYSSGLPQRPDGLRARERTGDVVLITGTTRGFGCDVLEHLLRDGQVQKVYAFNRKTGRSMEMQRTSFRERGLEEKLLGSPRLVMLEVDLDTPGFGVDSIILDEIRLSVTHIMHNAWKVDFNLSLPSFTADLQAVRNLIELSLSVPYYDPPKIQFVSSVGIFKNYASPGPVPETAVDPSSSLGTGYSEAKWIAERTLIGVMERMSVPVVIVRLGQICGDRLGHWNEREWFPALVKSSLLTHSLPDRDEMVTFIESYPAARSFVEMRHSPSGSFINLVHPRSVPWRSLLAPLAEELNVQLIPYDRWLSDLEQCSGTSDTTDNPALRLLGFFRRGPVSTSHIASHNAQIYSETLAALPQLDGKDIAHRWIAGWRRSRFLPPKQ